MTRSRAAVFLLVALTVTAGCSGPLFGDGGDERDPYGVPETTVAETTPGTATATASPATTATTTPAASLAFRRAVGNHSDALHAAGQFVVRQRLRRTESVGGSNRTTTLDRSFAADLDADRYWFGLRNRSGVGPYDSGVAYQDGTGLYQRKELPNGTVVYWRVPDARQRPPTLRGLVFRWIRDVPDVTLTFPFERNGSVTVDGERMARFTADGVPPRGCPGGVQTRESLRNVTAARATAVVDGNGLVRRFECVLAGRLHTGDWYRQRVTWAVSEVGTATLRPPDRLVNATERTAASGGTETSDGTESTDGTETTTTTRTADGTETTDASDS